MEMVDDHLVVTYTDGTSEIVSSITMHDGTDGLCFYPLPDGTYGVTSGTTKYLEEIVIPETYNGKAVTQILDHAFENAVNLKSIIIPETITHIGSYAFNGCAELEIDVVIPEEMTTIEKYTFAGCKKLKSVTIPKNVNTIKAYAFYEMNPSAIVTFESPTWWGYWGEATERSSPYSTCRGKQRLNSFADSSYANKCLRGDSVEIRVPSNSNLSNCYGYAGKNDIIKI